MSSKSPVRIRPIRPPCNYSVVGRGLDGVQVGVDGIGWVESKEVLGAEAGEELVETEEEAQAVSTLPSPFMPTQSEKDDHDLAHATYRS